MKEYKMVKWIGNHKKQLLLIGIGSATILAVVAGVKNKEAVSELLKKIPKEVAEANRYSNKWFSEVSDSELEREREVVRKAFCSSGGDFEKSCKLQNLLYLFDDEMSKRAWNGETPHVSNIHREHGWYLFNDD